MLSVVLKQTVAHSAEIEFLLMSAHCTDAWKKITRFQV
jgi:hypothetical protein